MGTREVSAPRSMEGKRRSGREVIGCVKDESMGQLLGTVLTMRRLLGLEEGRCRHVKRTFETLDLLKIVWQRRVCYRKRKFS